KPSGQHDDLVAARLFFMGQKRAADRCAHAEHVEKSWRHRHAADLFGAHIVAVRSGNRKEPISPPDHVIEGATLTTPVDKVSWRGRHRVVHGQTELGVDVVNQVQAFSVLEWWRSK